jgi:hypothetical protein
LNAVECLCLGDWVGNVVRAVVFLHDIGRDEGMKGALEVAVSRDCVEGTRKTMVKAKRAALPMRAGVQC